MQTKPGIANVDEPIVISDYDPIWLTLFTEEQRRVQTALGEIVTRIEHFGSTAVPGMAGKPIVDTVKVQDYVTLQRSGDLDEKRAIGSYSKTGFVHKISPQLVDAMVNGLEEHPQRQTHVGFQHCGGAISRVASDATAFPHRGIHATSLLTVDWPGDVDPAPHVKWLLAYWDTIRPHTDGFYTNDASDETQKMLDENYLGNLPRLVALKNRYDPTNLFRLNANVRPAAKV